MKLCECGCGLPAPISEYTDKRYGAVKGESLRFLVGHHSRKGSNKFEHRPDGTTVLFLEKKNGTTEPCYIDTADYPLVKDYRWYAYATIEKRVFYAMANIWKKNERTTIKMHSLLLPLPIGQTLDHKDFDGLNNRRSNLRPANRSQQRVHQQKREFTSSQYRGVCWAKDTNKWQAQITIDGKVTYLGQFDSEEDAANARDSVAKKYHGEFAVLNFPVTAN